MKNWAEGEKEKGNTALERRSQRNGSGLEPSTFFKTGYMSRKMIMKSAAKLVRIWRRPAEEAANQAAHDSLDDFIKQQIPQADKPAK